MFRKAWVVLIVCLSGVISAGTLVAAQDVSCDETLLRANVGRVIEEGFNQGDMTIVDETFAEAYISHPGDGNREAFKSRIQTLREAMPAGTASIEQFLVEGCNTFFVFHFGGTFQNALQLPGQEPLQPTGKPLVITSHVYLRFNEQGQTMEEWDYTDNFSLLIQAGVILSPAPEGDAAPDAEATEEAMAAETITTSGHESVFADHVRQSYEEGNTQYDVDLLRQLYAPEYTGHSVDGSVATLDQFIDNLAAVRAALPDVTYTVNDTVAQGSYVAARITLSGTFQNPLALPGQDAIQPTDQPITLEISFWHKLNEAGQIVEDWEIYDQVSLFAQLGVM